MIFLYGWHSVGEFQNSSAPKRIEWAIFECEDIPDALDLAPNECIWIIPGGEHD